MTLLKLEFKSLFRGLLLWTGILTLVLILFMAFFPSMESSAMQNLVGTKLDALSEPLLKIFGLTNIPDFTNITIYFAYVMQYINIAIAIYGALLGATALVKEETDGTIEYLYAQPITRNGIVGWKLTANFAVFCLLVLALAIISAILNLVFSSGKQEVMEMLMNVNKIYIGAFLPGIIFMAMGFFASVGLRSTKQTGSFAMGIVFGTYIVGIFATVINSVDFLRYLSPLELFKPSLIVTSGFNLKALGLWSGVLIISLVLTFALYNKKDLKV